MVEREPLKLCRPGFDPQLVHKWKDNPKAGDGTGLENRRALIGP